MWKRLRPWTTRVIPDGEGMAGRKQEHLNERIRQKLGNILLRESGDPRFQAVTISSVSVAKDLSTAKVFFSCYADGADPLALTESLNGAAGFLGHKLARTLTTRINPKLRFFYDSGFDYAVEVDRLLKEARESEKK